jgi:branched-subunit amino acid aminotransferase/4-amino-4-deoxychorismate lyase
MLDLQGYVAETNATNVFLVKRGLLLTPHADSCLPGITRAFVLQMAREHNIAAQERTITPAEVYSADEMFVSGTMGELTPVLAVDGRPIGDGQAGPLTRRLQAIYRQCTSNLGEPLPF